MCKDHTDTDNDDEYEEILTELEKIKTLLTNNNDKMSVQLKIDHIKATRIQK